ncbi:hypothetical protein [Alteribacter populi]|uniref:hypothetical protein n=1 Tax=Alteribacter populi TaxID=2011011 RepID=UPI000BBAE9FD|nr:hypothetical protein [Alteribacter populi]
MNVMEVLLSLPQKDLQNLLETMKVDSNVRSRQHCIELIIRSLSNHEERYNRYRRFSKGEQQLVTQMSFDLRDCVNRYELQGFLTPGERAGFSNTLRALENGGWFFKIGRDTWTMPEELKQRVRKWLLAIIEEERVIIPGDQDASLSIIDDLYTFMDCVEEKGFILTKQKTLRKNDLAKLQQSFTVRESLPEEQWRFGYGRHFYHYPNRFSLLYDVCFDEGWIRESNSLEVDSPRWIEAQKLSVTSVLTRVLQTYLNQYRRAIPKLPFIFKLLYHLLKTSNTAVSEEGIIKTVSPFIEPYYYDDVEAIIRERILTMLRDMHVFHIVQIGNEQFYCLSALQRKSTPFSIKNFS